MAPRLYIKSSEQLEEALSKWRDFSMFPSDYMSLRAVTASLDSDAPLVEAFSPYPGSWKVCPFACVACVGHH